MRFIKSVKGVEIAVNAIESVGPPRKVTSKTPEMRTVTTKSGATHDLYADDVDKLLCVDEVVTIVPAHPNFRLIEEEDRTPIVAWVVRSSRGDDCGAYPVLADSTPQCAIEYPDGRVAYGGLVYKNVDAMREALSTRREGERR